MKKLLTPVLALVALAVFTGPSVGQEAPQRLRETVPPTPGEPAQSSAGLVCRRAAAPAHDVAVDRCHGNWLPTDNTNNWKYQVAQGPDSFVRNSGSGNRSCAKCPNGGQIRHDFKGFEDWCVTSVPAVAAATAAPSCPSGFNWSGNICVRPGMPAHDVGVDRCHGNWLPTDNTNNWEYQEANGPDHFVRSTGNNLGNRACTKCPNGGNVHQDFKGLQDWCVMRVAAVLPATAAGSCPPGFTLGP